MSDALASGVSRRVSTWVAVAVALLGTCAVVVGLPPFPGECDDPFLTEGGSYSTQIKLWPPGALECEYVNRDGDRLTRTEFPARALLTVALAALGAWFVGSAVDRGVARRGARLAAGCALGLAAAVVWFGGV